MKELKSKKSGVVKTISDEEYAEIVAADKDRTNKILDRFSVTDLRMRTIIPSLKQEIKEVKITKKDKK